MDHKLEIKEEPVWLEGTDSYELASKKTHLREETKSELAEPKQSQFFADVKDEIFIAGVKDEIFIEEQTVGQLVPCFKEENVEEVPVFTRSMVDSSKETGSELMSPSPTDAEQFIVCNNQLTHSGEGSFHGRESKTTFPLKADKSQSGQLLLSCNECGKMFRYKSGLDRHALSHTRPHCCTVCGKTFSQKAHLTKHMLIHTGERQHRCIECGTTFSRKRTLNRHMVFHTVKPPLLL